jgi:hypothetical protein
MENITVPKEKAEALKILAVNVDTDVLYILAEKSKKPGMNKKVRDFKNLI